MRTPGTHTARGILAALTAVALSAGPAHAATLDVDVDNPFAGTSASPNPLNVTLNYDTGSETAGAPFDTLAMTFDRGLALGAPAGMASCTPAQVSDDETLCPGGSQVIYANATILAPPDPQYPDDGVQPIPVRMSGFNAPGGRSLNLVATISYPAVRVVVPVSLSGPTLSLQWPGVLQLLGPGGGDGLLNLNFSIGSGRNLTDAQEQADPRIASLSWVGAVSCAKTWQFSAVPADGASSAPASMATSCEPASPVSLDTPGIVTLPKPRKRKPGTTAPKGAGVCAHVRVGVQCGPGNGRRTAGGRDKVSHKGWPAVTGALMIADDHGRTITGSRLNDELLGANGSDRITGGKGNDIIWGDEWPVPRNTTRQHDTMRGGAGNDWIYTSHGTNTISAGAGNDTIYAYYGKGTINCGKGNDIVFTRRLKANVHFTMRNCERNGKI